MIQTSNNFLLFILYLSTKSANFQVRIERILATRSRHKAKIKDTTTKSVISDSKYELIVHWRRWFLQYGTDVLPLMLHIFLFSILLPDKEKVFVIMRGYWFFFG